MAQYQTWQDRLAAFLDRRAARRAGRARLTTAFRHPPEPPAVGLVLRGQQLVAGEFLFAGLRISDPALSIWDIRTDRADVIDAVQGCAWLDDLAALGDEAARLRAQGWVGEWITRFGDGTGPGWQAETTARRLGFWIGHSEFLLHRQDKATEALFLQSLARQMLFLTRRWQRAPAGLPRIATLAGVIRAAAMLDGFADHLPRAIAALLDEVADHIAADGSLQSRNPAALLDVMIHLMTAADALQGAGQSLPAALNDAVTRIAPVLRALRHADGGLARFHGGGRGADGRLDAALAAAGVKTVLDAPLAMGFARLSAGRTSVIVDAAPPPHGPGSQDAHASTLALEVTSGRRPMIVNCGAGARFGPDWHRASRATPSHATLGIDGVSSSLLGAGPDDLFADVPKLVRAEKVRDQWGTRLDLSHDGYQRSHGLTHARILHLSDDGRALTGEDLLTTLTSADDARFDHVFDQSLREGIRFTIRFHLHPDVTCALTQDGKAATIWLKSGEIWLFQHDGTARLALHPSVYLENGQLKPRPAQQVVLSGNALAYATRVRWTLAKAEDTPLALRDLAGSDTGDRNDHA
jgi:uncharacterized heparinase superfamily protein